MITDQLTKSAHSNQVRVDDNTTKFYQDLCEKNCNSPKGTYFYCFILRYSIYHQILGDVSVIIKVSIVLSTTFYPYIDGKSERIIQVLEDMLWAYVMDLGGQ